MFSKLTTKLLIDEIAQQPLARWFSGKGFTPQHLNGKLGILGVPFGKGQNKKGKDEAGLKMAPDFIRQTGFLSVLESLGMDLHDCGNVNYVPECSLQANNMHNLDHFAPLALEVSTAVSNILESYRGCLCLGGDHSIATGSIYGHMQVAGPKNVAVIYVDAHADINTSATSPSGNIHGMTVAMLAEEIRPLWPGSAVPGLDWLAPCLPLKNVAFIGLRSVDPGEARFLWQNNVAAFSMEDIGKCGIHKVLCKALTAIDPSSSKSIHLSFDIDSLDSLEAPCTTAPVRGGLTLREGIEICETVSRTGRMSVVDLVEVNPAIGTEIQRQTTLDAAKNVLLAMFGHSRRGNMKL
ncbi:hypothetical protein RUM44_014033 [Polyplax serrata]|uniref:Arginase n=1 Tax=Polyplax serrata TaxID=468196 RepID=A0ABR1BHZ6_POLSC